MYSESIEKLIKLFAKFPTIGPRTAARFVFYLINSPARDVQEILKAIAQIKNKVKVCSQCGKPFEPELNQKSGVILCEICSDPRRNQSQICVVEKEMDLEAIGKTGQFKGVYFILGSVARIDKNQEIMENKVRILLTEIRRKKAQKGQGEIEVIIALNPTPEGQNASFWLRRRLSDINDVRITQLGLGIPLGGEIEYADGETILSAFEGRK